MGSTIVKRLGDLANHLDDPAADSQFEALLKVPALKSFLAPRLVTHGLTSVRAYFQQLQRYTNEATAASITSPSFVTDNETDTVSVGQGRELFDRLTCPKTFRLFTKAEGAEGHCEGMAPIVFWTAALRLVGRAARLIPRVTRSETPLCLAHVCDGSHSDSCCSHHESRVRPNTRLGQVVACRLCGRASAAVARTAAVKGGRRPAKRPLTAAP